MSPCCVITAGVIIFQLATSSLSPTDAMKSFSFLKPARRETLPVVEKQLFVCLRESEHWQNQAEEASKIAEMSQIRFKTDQLLINKWTIVENILFEEEMELEETGQGQVQQNMSRKRRSADFLNIVNDPIIPSLGVFLPYGLCIVTISGFIRLKLIKSG